MDTASTLMGLGLLILFVAPVGYLIYDQSLKDKKRAKKLAFLTLKKGFKLDESDNITGLSIGLDRRAGKFFLLKSANDAKLQILDLQKVTKIELVKTDEDGKLISNMDEVREISLQVRNNDKSVKKIIFYAEEEDPVTSKTERFDNALKWQKNLQQNLK
ncbi:hypothetical protein HC174_02155 [Salinimicrobium sp. CDJ15-81-2]|nr:hypothetical protein [Salinimicrobium nanhaiense]